MRNKNKLGPIVFTIYIVIAFYVFGGGMINSMVAYRTWKFVGPNEFPKFHQADAEGIIPFFVMVFLATFILQLLLFWFRPLVISKSTVWTALALNLIVLISTATIQFPIQMELSKGLSIELIDKLIRTDFLFRRIPMVGLAIVNAYMLFKVVKHHEVSTAVADNFQKPETKIQGTVSLTRH